MRSKKAVLNIVFSLILEIITIASGFIIPRLVIGTFGSSVNGLTTSISQFLGYLILLQSGIGGVVKASLYKPLAKKDIEGTSRIIKAIERFFRKIAYITILYVAILAVIFPFIISSDFDNMYIALLVIIVGTGTFTQYYFGITYQMLLQADQKNYIYTIIQMCSLALSTLLIVVLINFGFEIHIIMLGNSLIFLIKPILLNTYVKKKYKLNKNCKSDKNAIKQRWDGFGHTVAYFIHNKTDIALLTIFSSLQEVSVYSTYILVTNGLNMFVSTVSSAVQAAFGNMIAKREYNILNKNFKAYECFIHMLTVILFTSGAVLIMPFISIYTKNFEDINYIRPLFAYIIIVAEGVYCIRQPYHSLIISAGHYRQTRNGAFIEAFINIVISLILVQFWGIIGVAVGTLSAMIFRTFDYVFYLQNNIIVINIRGFIRRMIINIFNVIIILIITNNIIMTKINTYLVWLKYSIYIAIISTGITIGINLVFYREDINTIYAMAKRLFFKNKDKA